MFCPGCGREYLEERRYCSACGINLQLVKQVIVGTVPPSAVVQQTPLSNRKMFKKLGITISFAGFLLTVVSGIISGAIASMIPSLEPIVEVFPAIFAVMFIFIGPMTWLYGRIIFGKEEVNNYFQQYVPQKNEALYCQPSVGYYYQPPPSVTEQTTARLRMPDQSQIKY